MYVDSGTLGCAFQFNTAPTVKKLTELPHAISQRIDRLLERQGMLESDEDNSTIALNGLNEGPMRDIHSHSVTCRIALGPQRGRKVFTL